MNCMHKFGFIFILPQSLNHAYNVSPSSLSLFASIALFFSVLQCGAWLQTAGGTFPGGYRSPRRRIWCACANSDQAHGSPHIRQSPHHQGTGQETAQEVFLVALSVGKTTTALLGSRCRSRLCFRGPKMLQRKASLSCGCAMSLSLNSEGDLFWAASIEMAHFLQQPILNPHKVHRWPGYKKKGKCSKQGEEDKGSC